MMTDGLKLKIGTILASCVMVLSGTAMATTYNVPGDYSSIQAAIDGSVSGDEILVGPGTYFENLVLTGPKSLTLKGTGGAGQTIIDGNHAGNVLNIFSPNGSTPADVKLEGFTVRNGGAAGIRAYGPNNLTINDSVITDNAGGLYLYLPRGYDNEALDVTINNTTIANNTALSGGAIFAYYHSFVTLNNCRLLNNTASYSGGAIYTETYGAVTMDKTFVTGNSAGIHGGGVYASTYTWVYATNSVIDQNRATNQGGAMYLSDGSGAQVANSTITRNNAPTGNSIATGTGPLYGPGEFWASNTIISANGNLSPYDAGPYFYDSSKIFIDHSVVSKDYTSEPFPGEGNIISRAGFVDVANGDYRLRSYGIGVDAGTSKSFNYLTLETDILGVSRPKGAGYDIGAYEFNDSTPPVSTATFRNYDNPNWGGTKPGYDYAFVVANLSASDDVAVKEIHYIVNGVETVVPGSTATVTMLNDGSQVTVFNLSWYAVDTFDNAETPQVRTFNVVQYLEPATYTLAGTLNNQFTSLYSSDVAMTVTAQNADGIREVHIFNTLTGVETVLPGSSATFTFSADAVYTLQYFVVNVQGYNSPRFTMQFWIDQNAPVNSSQISGTLGNNGWYTSDVNVTITAQDANTNNTIRYTLDGVENAVHGGTTTTAMVALTTDGVHSLSYDSYDFINQFSALTTLPAIKIDKTAPAVESSTPANGATEIKTNASITVNLSEDVTPGAALASIGLSKGGVTVASTKTLSGRQLTIKPSTTMSKSSAYTVTIPVGALVDAAGNPNAESSFTFNTVGR